MPRRDPTRRAPTINDVGAAAGVSRQTVSRAMNDMPGISAATRERVLAAAQRLHYRPSRFGRGLVTGEQRTLGLVIGDLTNAYFPELASAVVGRAAENGWNVLLSENGHDADPFHQLAELRGEVDAVVGYFGTAEAQRVLAGMAYVQIDAGRRPPGGAVVLGYDAAMRKLVQHLVERGCRRPVVLDESEPLSRRGREFVTCMRRHGIDTPVVGAAAATLTGGVEGTRTIVADYPHVDMIMAFNDTLACGALKALRLAGVDVPGEVRVAGFDGLQLGSYVTPQLTTLAVDMRAVAAAALELVIGMQAGNLPLFGAKVRRHVSYRMVIREST